MFNKIVDWQQCCCAVCLPLLLEVGLADIAVSNLSALLSQKTQTHMGHQKFQETLCKHHNSNARHLCQSSSQGGRTISCKNNSRKGNKVTCGFAKLIQRYRHAGTTGF